MKKTKRFHVEVLGKLHDYVITKNGDIYVDFLPFPMQLVYNKQKNRHEVISTFYREAGIKLMSGSLPFCLILSAFSGLRTDLLISE
jgi:hypothetical protein